MQKEKPQEQGFLLQITFGKDLLVVGNHNVFAGPVCYAVTVSFERLHVRVTE